MDLIAEQKLWDETNICLYKSEAHFDETWIYERVDRLFAVKKTEPNVRWTRSQMVPYWAVSETVSDTYCKKISMQF